MAKETKIKKNKIQTSGRIPPHSIDSEIAVLGAMLLNKEVSAKVISLFSNDAARNDITIFYDPRHQAIYNGIVDLFKKNLVPDIISLTEHLRKMGTLEDAGGTYYISEINRIVPTYAHYESHCRIVQEFYFKRCLIDAAINILNSSYDDTADALEVVDEAESEIFQIAEQRISKTYKDLSILSDETYKALLEQLSSDKNSTAVSTGYRFLDNKLNGGLQKSDLIILAARPSMGKSAFALMLAYNAARAEVPVGFFSLEMSARQLVIRLLNLDMNYAKAEQNRRTVQTIIKETTDASKNAAQEIINSAFNSLAPLPIYFDDTAAISIMELRAKCRQMKAEKKIGLIIVDYLQLIRSPKTETREREIAVISSTLKQIARELDVPVLALAQLNRVYESRVYDGKGINAQKTPILSDLRESGSIEQDADVVMFIHRPEALLKNDPDKDEKIAAHNWNNLAQVVIEKHRNGETGMVDLDCFIEYGIFHNREITFNNSNISQANNISQSNNYQKNTNNNQINKPQIQQDVEDKEF